MFCNIAKRIIVSEAYVCFNHESELSLLIIDRKDIMTEKSR